MIDPHKLADTRLDEPIDLDDIHPDLRLDFANAEELRSDQSTQED